MASRIAAHVAEPAGVGLHEDLSPELLRRVAAGELVAAAVFETPSAARRLGVRIDALRDEPLLAAVPAGHELARGAAVPVGAFAGERVLLPREPAGRAFNEWLRAVVRTAGHELERTLETPSAPWDRRMLPVAEGAAFSVFVGEWAVDPIPGVAAVPFDPPLTFPVDLASSPSPTDAGAALLRTALGLRDAGGWLTQRPARTELTGD